MRFSIYLLLAAAVGLLAPAASAGVFWVDVGDDDSGTLDSQWNTVSLFTEGIPPSANGDQSVTSADGTETASVANIAISANERGFHSTAGTIYPPADAWVTQPAGDYEWLFDNDDNDVVTLSFDLAGLNDASPYTLEVFSARYDAGTEFVDITANGAFSDTGASEDFNFGRNSFSSDEGGQVLTWTDLSPSGGVISVSVTGKDRLGLNAFRLTEVPEPATLSLMALGLAGLVRRRRSS